MLVYDVWLLCDVSMHRASTQPRLIVLPHAYRVLVCWCVVVLVGGCVGVLWWCGVGVFIVIFILFFKIVLYFYTCVVSPSPE